MKKLRVMALLMSVGLSVSSAMPVMAAETGTAKIAFMSCSKGDRVDITLDKEEVSWSSSDSNIAAVGSDGIISITGEGSCDLTNSDTGFTVKVDSEGETSNTRVLSLNYTVDVDSLKSVVKKDSTVSIQTVEVNSTVQVDESDVPSSFSQSFTGSVEGSSKIVNTPEVSAVAETVDATATNGGIFTTEDVTGNTVVVKVIDPQINQYAYYGSVGNTINVQVSDTTAESVTYASENTDVAMVDENGLVTLLDEGETNIIVSTGTNNLRCKIVSVRPMVDTSDVILKDDEVGHISIEDNFADLPVSYSIVSGDGEVSEDGEVTVNSGTVVVRVMVGDFAYEKSFTLRPTYYYASPANSIGLATDATHAQYWEAMQPYIQECLGLPYVWGGSSPSDGGMDCSGYVSYVLSSVGLISGRADAQGLYDMCTATSQPQPGDLVFFQGTYDTPGISHVGIYAGDGMMYHSGDPNTLTSFDTPYWRSHLVGYGTLIASSDKSYDSGVAGYTQEQLELIWAIVAQEDSTSYEGALAVITSAMNRADINYGGHGTDPLSQLTAPGQYCYSPSVSDPALWQVRLNGNVADYVKQAVSDCLNSGLRNHSYLSFRSNQAEGRVQIGENWYF